MVTTSLKVKSASRAGRGKRGKGEKGKGERGKGGKGELEMGEGKYHSRRSRFSFTLSPLPLFPYAICNPFGSFGVWYEVKEFLQIFSLAFLVLVTNCALANAQTESNKTSKKIASSSSNLIEVTNQYKDSSKELLAIQQTEVNKASAKLEQLRTLVSDGLVAKAELATAEQDLAELRGKMEATEKQIADSDTRVAQIKAEQQLAKKNAGSRVKLIGKQYETLSNTAMMLRYNGPIAWSRGNLDTIQAFFSSKFGHSLPTSAVGQSATHNRLGYDHRNAVDVALHPDSTEGRALISYLQQQGIPFLAFRGAIPGVATGPHIHIGSPSHRLS